MDLVSESDKSTSTRRSKKDDDKRDKSVAELQAQAQIDKKKLKVLKNEVKNMQE